MRRNLVGAYYRFACLCNVNSDSVSALKTEAALWEALAKYLPPRTRVNAVLFRSDESLRAHIDPNLGWKDVIEGKLETYDLMGDHHTILSGLTVSQIADVIQETLNSDERPEKLIGIAHRSRRPKAYHRAEVELCQPAADAAIEEAQSK
jgi:hypothetical protein